jgi:hypothetical protein
VIWNHPYGFWIQVYPENRNTVVVDNTVVGSAHSAIVVGGPEGVSNVTIRDNVFAFNARWGVELDSSCPRGGVVIDHNVLFGNGFAPIESRCSRSVDVSGGNSRGNPRFVDRRHGNFRLRGTSAARNLATPAWSMRSDILGRRRPLGPAPDAGAYERS